MASKFQKSIAEIRSKVALQGAETIARLKQVETDLHQKLDCALTGVHTRLSEGFVGFEAALVDHTTQSQANLESLLDQVVAMEQEELDWRRQIK